jgi:hypothetical protein
MGIFDRFRKPTGKSLLEQLKSVYALEEKTPYESSIMGEWWEGRIGDRSIAFQNRGRGLAVFVGKAEEISDIYLVRRSAGRPVPADASAAHIERIAGPEGKALASQFYLGALPQGRFDFPQLRLPALRDGIPQFSSSVQEVMLFESLLGLNLITDPTATLETMRADVKLALVMIEALDPANPA